MFNRCFFCRRSFKQEEQRRQEEEQERVMAGMAGR